MHAWVITMHCAFGLEDLQMVRTLLKWKSFWRKMLLFLESRMENDNQYCIVDNQAEQHLGFL